MSIYNQHKVEFQKEVLFSGYALMLSTQTKNPLQKIPSIRGATVGVDFVEVEGTLQPSF